MKSMVCVRENASMVGERRATIQSLYASSFPHAYHWPWVEASIRCASASGIWARRVLFCVSRMVMQCVVASTTAPGAQRVDETTPWTGEVHWRALDEGCRG